MCAQILAILMLGPCGVPAMAGALEHQNFLQIGVAQFSESYVIDFAAGKTGATSCEITTPRGTYTCVNRLGHFEPGADFRADHSSLPFADLSEIIETPWTLVWDAGFPAETTVTIDFGVIQASQFYPAPTLVFPVDGVVYGNPEPNPFAIEWTYGVAPCVVQLDYVGVGLYGPNGTQMIGDDLVDDFGCDVTSWTPPAPLGPGSWQVYVYNGLIVREVPDGLVIDPLQGWVLENQGWLGVFGASQAEIGVPTQRATLGQLKALFR